MGDDDIDLALHQLVGKLLGTFASTLGIMKFDCDVAAFRIAEWAQPSPECIGEWMRWRRRHQHTGARYPSGQLCARGQRPCSRAAEKGDEPAPFHCLILPCFRQKG